VLLMSEYFLAAPVNELSTLVDTVND
jgi:hypothetical protein